MTPPDPARMRVAGGSACIPLGEVAERSKAAVLKTARAQALEGSNPSLSAKPLEFLENLLI